MSYTTATLTGTLTGSNGSASAGTVLVIPSVPVVRDTVGNVVLSGAIGATLDGAGHFSVTVPASDATSLDPVGVSYTVIVNLGSGQVIRTPSIVANGGTTQDLAQILTLSPAPAASAAPLETAAHALASYEPRADLATWPTYLYGNSYAVLNLYSGVGQHYSELVASKLGGGSVTSYAVSGTRIVDTLGGLVNGSPITGSVGQQSGALWPGSSRSGLVVLETAVNDTGHYPTHVGTAIPADITSANTKYLDGMKGMYRAALAIMSSGTRVEQSTGTFTGTWNQTASPQTYASGGSVAFTNSVGAKVALSVTPPQYGPLAGKVFLLSYKLDAAAGTMAQMTIDVDGASSFNVTPNAWEQYAGPSGTNINTVWECTTITVPIDGAAHTVNVTHSGSAGQWMYVDSLIVPDVNPNPIVVMGGSAPVTAVTWTAPQVATFQRNTSKVATAIQSVVTEFGNAVFAACTMTTNGIRVQDGIHPNARGYQQRANDLLQAVRTIRPRLDNRALSIAPDAQFGL